MEDNLLNYVVIPTKEELSKVQEKINRKFVKS